MPGDVPRPPDGAVQEAPARLPWRVPDGRRGRVPGTAVVLLLVAACFSPALDGRFLTYDDALHVTANPLVTSPGMGLPDAWRAPREGLYIPVTYSAWMLLARAWTAAGGEGIPPAELFHGAGLLVHLGCGLLALGILRRVLRREGPSVAGALLFALHPFQVEAVAWVSGFKEQLGTFFTLLAVQEYLASAEAGPRGRWVRYATATAAFALAVLSHPLAVAAPAVAGIVAWSATGRSLRRLAAGLLPWVGLAVPVILATHGAQAGTPGDAGASPWLRPLIAGDALAFYAGRTLLPLGLGPDAGRTPQWVLSRPWTPLVAVLPLLAAGLVAWKVRDRVLLAAGLVFVAALVPVLGFVPFLHQAISTVADRYVQLALLGPALAFGRLADRVPRAAAPGLAAVVLALGAASFVGTGYWNDDRTLAERALEANPRSWVFHSILGVARSREGDLAGATALFRQSLALSPDYVDALNNLAVARMQAGAPAEALEPLERALRLDPSYPLTSANLGLANHLLHRPSEAARHLERAVALDDGLADAHGNLGVVRLAAGQLGGAVQSLRTAVSLAPGFPRHRFNLGLALARLGRTDEAARCFREVLALDPGHAAAQRQLDLLGNGTGGAP